MNILKITIIFENIRMIFGKDNDRWKGTFVAFVF